jgi:hypothetical protein
MATRAGNPKQWGQAHDLGTDHSYTATPFIGTAGENLVFGDFCYLKSDGKHWKADGGAAATMPCSAMAVDTIAADASGLLVPVSYGLARDDSWNWTPGDNLYVQDTTAGALQNSAPGSGKFAQIVGRAKTADVIEFSPYVVVTQP